MKHEDFCELAALYALDVLEEPDCRLVEKATLEFPELETQLAEFGNCVAAIAYSAPAVPMAPDLKERLFQRIAGVTLEQKTTPVDPPPIATSVTALTEKAADVSWEPYSIPGVMVGTLYVDKDKREIACFVRAEGGVRFPNHLHAAAEEIVVVQGDLVIDGKIYGSGECIRSSAGSAHQPETYGGCLLFLRTSLDDEVLA